MSSQTFLTNKQERRIIEAIEEAELRTSGEIRVHLEENCEGDALEQAATIFHELGMDETRLQNGVLIYIAYEDHRAAVYAGKGIHREVEDHFWEDVLEILLQNFRQKDYEKGIIEAVRMTGHKLSEMYPYSKTDRNELSNEISYDDGRSEK